MRRSPGDELERLLAVEGEHGVLPQPDYDTLAELADAWRELWPTLLQTGGGSGLVRALVAGIRDHGATDLLAYYARERRNDLLLRGAAVIALGRTGAEGTENLLLELCDLDAPIRRLAARELARLDSEWGRVTLGMQLDDEGATAGPAAAALARRGDARAVQTLRRLLEEQADVVAAETLGDLAVCSAVPGLLGLLHDDDPGRREIALLALGEVGDPRALPFVIGMLDDTEQDLRVLALEVIYAITGRRPVDLSQTADAEAFVKAARTWWQQARRRLMRRRAYHQGRPRTPGQWLEDLIGLWQAVLRPDRCDSLAARIEVATGEHFGFDAYRLDRGPNEAALRRWVDWWNQSYRRFLPGLWYWQGERLAEATRWP